MRVGSAGEETARATIPEQRSNGRKREKVDSGGEGAEGRRSRCRCRQNCGKGGAKAASPADWLVEIMRAGDDHVNRRPP